MATAKARRAPEAPVALDVELLELPEDKGVLNGLHDDTRLQLMRQWPLEFIERR